MAQDLLKNVLGIGDNVLDFAKNSLNTMKLTGKQFFDTAASKLRRTTAPAVVNLKTGIGNVGATARNVGREFAQLPNTLSTFEGQQNFTNRFNQASKDLPLSGMFRTLGNLGINRFAAPMAQAPQAAVSVHDNLQRMVAPNQSLSQRMAALAGAGVDTLRVAAGLTPIDDPIMMGYDFVKGINRAENRGKGFIENAKSGIQSVSLEKPTGLGETFFKDPTLQTIGNAVELPLMIGAGRIAGKRAAANHPTLKLIRENIDDAIDALNISRLQSKRLYQNNIPLDEQWDDLAMFDKKLEKIAPDLFKDKALQKLKIDDPKRYFEATTYELMDRIEAINPTLLGLNMRSTRSMGNKPAKTSAGDNNLPDGAVISEDGTRYTYKGRSFPLLTGNEKPSVNLSPEKLAKANPLGEKLGFSTKPSAPQPPKPDINQPNVLNNEFFLPKPEETPRLTAGTKEVSTGKEARKALNNQMPGQDIEVNNPQKPGNKPLIAGSQPIEVNSAEAARRVKAQFPEAKVVVKQKELPTANEPIPLPPEDSAIPRTGIGDVEKSLYGSQTAKPEDLGGTKEGAGRISDFLRTIQAKASDTVARGLESQNPIIRNTARLAQGFSGGLGKSKDQVENKIRYKGSIDYGTKLATDVQDKVREITGGDLDSYERIHAVMDPELAKEKISYDDLSDKEKEATDFLRMVSDFINDTNYRNGFISKEKWLANKGGKYIARAYEDYDFPPEVADFMKQRNAKFDLNPFKQRGEVTDWKQENAIRDPAYLTAKRLQQTLFNDEVRRYSDWLGSQKNLVSDTAKDGYVQLSDHKAYGDLAGKWVRKDALEDIRGFFFTNDIAQKTYDVLNWWDRNPLRRARKKLLTVYNPAVRLGNETGNYVFAWLNGINPVIFGKNRQWAKEALENNDPISRRMMKDGLLGSDVTKADIARMATELKQGITDEGTLKKIDNVITESYGRVDDIAKLSAMKTWLDRGYTYEEASRRVQSGFQSYSMVGFLYDLGAKVPVFGNPFVRFASEMTRITKNAVVDHPVRAVATVAAWKLFTDVMSRMSGETAEDKKTREERIGAPRIPFTNISLAVQTPWGEVNAARLIGLYSMNSTESNMNSDVSKIMPFQTPSARNLGSDPVIGPLVSLAIDKDFRGKSISDPDQNKYTGSTLTDEEKNTNRLKYLVRSYNLPSLNDISDIVAAGKGEENFYGQKRTLPQATARLFGLKVEKYGAEEAQSARDKDLQYQQNRLEANQRTITTIKNQLKRGEIDQTTAEKRIKALQTESPKPTKTGSVKLSPYLKEMYGIDKVEAMGAGTEYDQLKREKEAYKTIDKILDDEVLDDSQKQAAIDSLGLKKTDVDYYRLANETADLKAVYIQENSTGLEHEELVQYLIAGRRKVNGKMVADNSVLDYLYDEGIISKTETKQLKKIEYDRDGNLITPSGSGSGSSAKLTKEYFNNQIEGLKSLPKLTPSKATAKTTPADIASPKLFTSETPEFKTKANITTADIPKANQVAMVQPKKTGVSQEAYKVVSRAKGGGSVNPSSTPRKLSKSFFRRA